MPVWKVEEIEKRIFMFKHGKSLAYLPICRGMKNTREVAFEFIIPIIIDVYQSSYINPFPFLWPHTIQPGTPLVDSGISEVPLMYIQPPHERFEKINEYSSSSKGQFSSVPIDLSKLDGPEQDQVAEAIVRAAETLGFFQVINHGLDLDLLESLKVAAYRFFAQPAEAKAVYLKGVSPSPLVKYETSFVPEKEKVLQWRDYLSMFYANDAVAEKYWPKECKEEALQYLKLSMKMVRKLFEILIENLGVKLEDSKMESLLGFKAVNMNFYPPCPNPELTVGVARHSDMGILTVLLQDEIGGLYVKAEEEDIPAGKKEEWIEIPPIHGALVINVGDSLQVRTRTNILQKE